MNEKVITRKSPPVCVSNAGTQQGAFLLRNAQKKEDRMKTIELTPNFENTAAFFATALRDHNFDRGATEPIVSFIEQIRYLTQIDIDAVERIIKIVGKGGR